MGLKPATSSSTQICDVKTALDIQLNFNPRISSVTFRAVVMCALPGLTGVVKQHRLI